MMIKIQEEYYRGRSKRAVKRRLIERKDKKLYMEEHRSKKIRHEARKMGISSTSFYRGAKIKDVNSFLALRDEDNRIYRNYLNHKDRWTKYVKGGGTFFYTPMKKKERRKALRKYRLHPLSYYLLIYDENKLLNNNNKEK